MYLNYSTRTVMIFLFSLLFGKSISETLQKNQTEVDKIHKNSENAVTPKDTIKSIPVHSNFETDDEDLIFENGDEGLFLEMEGSGEEEFVVKMKSENEVGVPNTEKTSTAKDIIDTTTSPNNIDRTPVLETTSQASTSKSERKFKNENNGSWNNAPKSIILVLSISMLSILNVILL